jgi:hypothetical protein
MEECSFNAINNEPCHRAIRAGICPGAVEGKCVNEIGIRVLTRKYEEQAVIAWSLACAKKREEKARFRSHFVDQSDPVKPKDIQTTLSHLSRLIKRVRQSTRQSVVV